MAVPTNKRPKLELDPDGHPWGMQPTEGWEQFEAFTIYRDMGARRTLERAAELWLEANHPGWGALSPADRGALIETRYNLHNQWSGRGHWVVRARAYDSFLDAERVDAVRQEQRKAAAEAGKRHAQIALGTVMIAAEFLKKFHDKMDPKFKNKRLEDMTVGEFLAVGRQGVAQERLVLGLDTQSESSAGEATASGVPAGVSFEEAKAVAQAAAAAAVAAEPPAVDPLPPPEDDDAAPAPAVVAPG
ncbi:MAG: hypothetical protein K2X82_08280 [Gemmataceae bacterium]|nr:hypothetical protein [Gemmataceae bacterium]